MNQDTLSHIANQNETLSADAVMDLVQMCQTFPYFSVPYIILSKHYAAKNDFRTENTLFQAALRTPDRAWLFDFINGKQSNDSTIIEQEIPSLEIQPETPEISNLSTELKVETTVDTHPINNQAFADNIEIAEIITIPDIEIESTKKTSLEVVDLLDDSAGVPQINFDKEPESKFETEEILIDKTEDAPILAEVQTYDKEPESMFFVPSTEAEPLNETEDLEVEKTNRTWLFAPEISADQTSPEVKITKTEIQHTPKLTFGGGYNIEDYFKLEPAEISAAPQSSNNVDENTDFFSWLNSGIANQGPMNKPAESAKSSLIDKFIQENPSIQRPKKEFFSPEKAMKKSEVLDLNIATETLANIYTLQGYPEKAIKVYKQLQLKFPEKLSYFASLIEKLKLEHNL